MNAWAFKKYKQEIELIELPEPVVKANDVLIKVHAVGLNHVDEKVRKGEFKAFMSLPLPYVLGHDLSGEIVSIGSGVKNFKVGDIVYSRPSTMDGGTLVQFKVVDESEVALIPQNISPVEAAALPLVSLTAWQALVEVGNIQEGNKVLIHGGAGGVGIVAIQIAKYLGAFVATTVNKDNVEFAKSLGADLVIDYTTQEFEDLVNDYDLVLETVGGSNLMKSFQVLKKDGLVVCITGPADTAFAQEIGARKPIKLIISLLSRKVLKQAQKNGVKYRFLMMRPEGRQLQQIAKIIEAGKLKPMPVQIFPFNETKKAFTALASGSFRRGKVVVKIQ